MAAGRNPASPPDNEPKQMNDGQLAVTIRLLPFGTTEISASYPAGNLEHPKKEEVRVVRGGTGGIQTIAMPKPTIER